VPVTLGLGSTLALVSVVGTLAERQTGVGLNLLDFRVDLVLSFQLWRLVTYPFVESTLWGFLLSLAVLWLFGGWFELRYGARDYLRFVAFSGVGAGLLAIPLTFLLDLVLPFEVVGIAEGPTPIFNAMLVATALAVAAQLTSNRFSDRTSGNLVFFPLAVLISGYSMIRCGVLGAWRGGIVWRGTFYPSSTLRQGRRYGTAFDVLQRPSSEPR